MTAGDDSRPGGRSALATLMLVRHGVTAWNRERRFQGQIDTPLSEEGHRQARRLAARLAAGTPAIRAVYSSDLRRARDTAAPIAQALGLPLLTEPGLRERGYGAFEGMTFEEIERDLADAYRRWRLREPDFELPGGGESLGRFHDRVAGALERLAGRHPGEAVIAVTHGGVLDSAYRIASGLALEAPRRHELLNASLNTIAGGDRGFRLVDWADVAHLDGHDDDVTAAR